jgi:hypothetical protein
MQMGKFEPEAELRRIFHSTAIRIEQDSGFIPAVKT